jgi:hypothetical protein
MPTLPLRVQQSTSTSGTGTVALNAAAAGRRSYQDAYGTGSVRVAYVISGASFFEIGYGDFDGGSPGNLTRVAVVASSNAGALVSLPVGTADVFPVIDPSERELVTGIGTITLALADIGNVVLWTGSAAASVNLPAAASVPAGRGWLIANDGSAALTIDPNGTETITNATTLLLSVGASVEVMRAGGVWIALNHIAGALPGLLASPPAIGGITPAAGKFTSLAVTAGDINTSNGSVTLNRVGADAVVSLNSAGGSGRAFTVGSANSGIFYIGDSTASVIRMTIDAAGNGAFGGALTVNGVLAAPTAAPGTNNTQVATTAFANAAAAAAAANSVKADVGNLQVRYGAFSATAGGSGDVTLSTPFPTVNLLVLICPTGIPGTNNAVAAYATSPGTFHWIWSSTTGGSFNMQYIALGY